MSKISIAKKNFKKVFRVSLLIIGIPILLISSYGQYVQYNENFGTVVETKKAISSIVEQYNKFTDETKIDEKLPKLVNKKFDGIVKAKNDSGEIEKVFKEYMSQVLDIRNNYLLELQAIGWNNILDPDRIKKDKTLEKSLFIIERGREIIKKYEEIHINFMTVGFKTIIEESALSVKFREKFFEGYYEGLEKALSVLQKQWVLEEKIIDECESMINLLNHRKKYWTIENNTVFFKYDNDLSHYNTCLANIQKYVKQQENIQKENIDNTKIRLQNIKDKL